MKKIGYKMKSGEFPRPVSLSCRGVVVVVINPSLFTSLMGVLA